METKLDDFVEYLSSVKGASNNTIASYKRDIIKLNKYLEEQGYEEIGEITETSMNSYVLYLEKELPV